MSSDEIIMTKLNFSISGGVATGTSFLAATLTKHPDIFLPTIQRPEPNFFHYTHKYTNGIDWYLNTWFHDVKNERAIGDRSSLQMPSELAPQRLKKAFPNIKLIFCLRNPIERAWANYRFTVLEGLECLPFDEALKQENERTSSAVGDWREIQPHQYIKRGMYSACLKEYLSLFGRDNILFVKSENLAKDTPSNIRKICSFLDVDDQVNLPTPANYSSPSVADIKLQSELRQYFGPHFSSLVESIRQGESVAKPHHTKLERSQIERLKNNLHGGKINLDNESRKFLREIFQDEIKAIADIVDFETNDWI